MKKSSSPFKKNPTLAKKKPEKSPTTRTLTKTPSSATDLNKKLGTSANRRTRKERAQDKGFADNS